MKRYTIIIFLVLCTIFINLFAENSYKSINFNSDKVYKVKEEDQLIQVLTIDLPPDSHFYDPPSLAFVGEFKQLRKLIFYHSSTDKRTTMSAVKSLPILDNLEEFVLRNVSGLNWIPDFKQKDMDEFLETIAERSPNLKFLDLGSLRQYLYSNYIKNGFGIPRLEAVAHLFPYLEGFHLPGCLGYTTRQGVEDLKNLRYLKLSGNLNEEDEIALMTIPTLEILDLTSFVGMRNLENMGPLLELTELRGIAHSDLNYSRFAPHLKKIKIESKNMSSVHLNHIGENKNLESLNMIDCHFSPENIEQSQWTIVSSLIDLDLRNSNVKGIDFYHFAPNLRTLNLEGTNIRTSEVKKIVLMESLEELYLGNTSITHGSVKSLSTCLALKKLDLKGNKLKGAAFDELARLNQLESLDLSQCDFSVEDFKKLEKLTQIKELKINHLKNGNISKEMIQNLQNLIPDCKISL